MTRRREHVLLSGHLVRLLPAKDDLADRVPTVLTARDWEILTAIDLHGYLPLELIALAYFPSPGTDVRPSTRA